MRTSLLLTIFLVLVVGCGGTAQPTTGITEEAKTLDTLQGKWQVLQIVGPDGKGYEGKNVIIEIKDNIAFQNGNQLRLEFIPDSNTLRMIAKTDQGEKEVGIVSVTVTTAKPIQALLTDKNSKQETLLEKVE